MTRDAHFAIRYSPLILLHGNYASPRWWEPVRGRLPGSVTTFAPDMRRWVENGRTTIPSLAATLAEFIRERDLVKPIIAGHSLGGVVATQFALDQPDTVQGLVLIATGPPEGVPWGRFVTSRRLPSVWLRRRMMKVALSKAGLPRHHPLSEALVEDALETDPATYAAFSHAVARWNVSERLGELALPALLIWGERDPIMPLKIGWRLRELIPHSRLATLPGVGHSPPIEAPEAVTRHLLAFVDEQAPDVQESVATTQPSWPRRLLNELAVRLKRQSRKNLH
jgi:pimeloyl-ACP methyl ester carboxylesterase